MRILLVNPPPYQCVEPEYDTPDFPRTGLAFLAGYLRRENIDVHVLDCKFDRLNYADGMDRVKTLRPDIVGFSAFTNEIVQAGIFANMVKEFDPSIQTVIGGVHVSALPEDTMREFPQFDYGVVGEGEITLHDFVTHLGDYGTLASTPGICFLDHDGRYVFGGPRQKIADQNTIPHPAWDLFRPAGKYWVQTSRGCPYACLFCMNPNGRAVRPRSPDKVFSELEWLAEHMKPYNISFGDEIFTINRDRTIEICRGIIDRNLQKEFEWFCVTHVRAIDEEKANLMKASGCALVGLGIESGDEQTLKTIGKGTNLQFIQKTIDVLRKAKLNFQTFFILGQPNETYQSAKNTIKYAVKLNPKLPVFGIMVPYPGTKIAKMAEKGEGGYILLSHDWYDD